ncbi:DUF1178 family protein [Aquabacterium parvum]|jgi:hypothetical protein|uniref:DUF1178 family protein n=1 Tax=Aquabacterium parvum TaxID=70584 RepID=UPI0009F9361A|nr:DUF1178 family protein [Aquabacterium parvum]MBU0915643.1 DUF1178 family protein [Gammaproteobacteria bacterium]
MLVVDLHCEHGHVFEGWFASADDLASQQARGLVSCPVCASTEVVRRPSAVRLNVSALKAEKSGAQAPVVGKPAHPSGHVPSGRGEGAQTVGAQQRESQAPASRARAAALDAEPGMPSVEVLQAMYLQAVRHVLEQTEDVGEGFVKEVRNIHRGDAPQRALRGQADQDEVTELKEEGIDVMSLAIPESLKGPLQ